MKHKTFRKFRIYDEGSCYEVQEECFGEIKYIGYHRWLFAAIIRLWFERYKHRRIVAGINRKRRPARVLPY